MGKTINTKKNHFAIQTRTSGSINTLRKKGVFGQALYYLSALRKLKILLRYLG